MSSSCLAPGAQRTLIVQHRMLKTQAHSQGLPGIYLLKQERALTSFELVSVSHGALRL